MKYFEVTPGKLLEELSNAGRLPDPDLIDTIYERRDEMELLMLDLFREAYHDEWDDESDPRGFRFLHAGSFMLSWQVLEALPTFADLYANTDDEKQDLCEWYEEDLYHYGPPVIPYMAQVLTSESDGKWHYGRALASSILTDIAQYYPETRAEIVAIFRSHLPDPDEVDPDEIDEMWADIADELGILSDEGSRDKILALENAKILSPDVFDRQFYLREMNHGFQIEKPPPPYDIRSDYRHQHKYRQDQLQREAKIREREQLENIRKAQTRTGPKIGRNEPCPCGSGKKYKKCHGRPGA